MSGFSAPRPAGVKPGGAAAGSDDKSLPCVYYSVMFCKYSRKKHKTYDDGILVLAPARKATLQTMEGKDVATEHTKQTTMRIGGSLSVRSYDLEVVNTIAAAEYESGRIFIAAAGGDAPPPGVRAPPTGAGALAAAVARGSAAASKALAKGGNGKQRRQAAAEEPGSVPRSARARFDPLAEGALVLQWPEGAPRTEGEARARWAEAQSAPGAAAGSAPGPGGPSRLSLQQACGVVDASGRARVPVVLDPALAASLRPHQRLGVQFLWGCVAGVRPFSGSGAILADAMGLGKTLQSICLVATALRQSDSGQPLASKAVIVCPSSLVSNWRREFRKWLGDQKCRPVAVTKGGKAAEEAVRDFCVSSSAVSPVLLISYEQFRRYAPLINGGKGKKACEVGLLICDEGHRLKNSDGNQTIAALAACPCRRRVILTGTPIQNRLDEFYACCSFVNPDLLGPLAVFRRVFQGPIQRGRDRSASSEEQAIGAERSKELGRLASHFILRRTQRILDRYLPSKTESCVFCRPTAMQMRLYRSVLAATSARYAASARGSAGGAAAAEALTAVGMLRKLCNSPALLWADAVSAAVRDGEEGAGALTETTTLRATAAGVVAAMHRQMGVQGGTGGKAAKRRPAASAEAEEAEDEEDDIGDLSDSDDDSDDGGSPAAAGGAGRAPKRRRALHAPVASMMTAFSPEWRADPDPVRTALRALGLLAADGRSLAAKALLPIATSPAERAALPAELRSAGDALASSSGKLRLLDALMTRAVQTGAVTRSPDKLVIVSNYTSTLDVVAGLCACRGVAFLRLDGSTASERRAALVAAFNRPAHPSRVLLLSSKAGGVGLNLVGANRLVLVDVDWNPATDRQAMARVWRDGQAKRCAIYRLSLSGTLEEKVLQRQLLKEEVSSAIVDGDTGAGRSFSADELRRLFDDPTVEAAGTCTTFAMLSERKAAHPAAPTDDEDDDDDDEKEEEEDKEEEAAETGEGLSASWTPYSGPDSIAPDDDVLADAIAAAGADDTVSYAQCTWFNRQGGGAGAPPVPRAKGLDGSAKAAPGRAALAELSSSSSEALALAEARPEEAAAAAPSAVEDPAPAAKRACSVADDVFSAILSGAAPAVL